MKKVRRVAEAEVIAGFLQNEFYEEDFHDDRDKFEHLVLDPDLNDPVANAIRRSLLYRRRGHMWRELPPSVEWWQVELEPPDIERLRVFPRKQWRKIAGGNFRLEHIARQIRQRKFPAAVGRYVSKVQSLSYWLRRHQDPSAVVLIGIDEEKPTVILEGNHRITAALLAGDEVLYNQFRIYCGFSPHMAECCWYDSNFATLWRYFKNRLANIYDPEADLTGALHQHQKQQQPGLLAAEAEAGRQIK